MLKLSNIKLTLYVLLCLLPIVTGCQQLPSRIRKVLKTMNVQGDCTLTGAGYGNNSSYLAKFMARGEYEHFAMVVDTSYSDKQAAKCVIAAAELNKGKNLSKLKLAYLGSKKYKDVVKEAIETTGAEFYFLETKRKHKYSIWQKGNIQLRGINDLSLIRFRVYRKLYVTNNQSGPLIFPPIYISWPLGVKKTETKKSKRRSFSSGLYRGKIKANKFS